MAKEAPKYAPNRTTFWSKNGPFWAQDELVKELAQRIQDRDSQADPPEYSGKLV